MANRGIIGPGVLLVITAAIWGSAFVAQRAGMESIGPFAFNGARFLFGAAVVAPFLIVRLRRGTPLCESAGRAAAWIVAAGVILFGGSVLQQIGLVTTSAGKAGFITGLYIVIVPLLGTLLGHRPRLAEAAGAVVATAGLFLLTMTDEWTVSRGDLAVLGGAFLWSSHVLLLARISPRIDTFLLAAGQFVVNGMLSLAAAFAFERPATAQFDAAALPILYGGILSVGIAYTLQVAAQKDVPPTLAAIIMSLESVFAALAGWLLLDETMGPRVLAGAALMLAGTVAAQISPVRRSRPAAQSQ